MDDILDDWFYIDNLPETLSSKDFSFINFQGDLRMQIGKSVNIHSTNNEVKRYIIKDQSVVVYIKNDKIFDIKEIKTYPTLSRSITIEQDCYQELKVGDKVFEIDHNTPIQHGAIEVSRFRNIWIENGRITKTRYRYGIIGWLLSNDK